MLSYLGCRLPLVWGLSVALWLGSGAVQAVWGTPPETSARTSQKVVVVQEGISVEFSLIPATATASDRLVQVGENARVQFKIRDATSGAPMSGLYPAAWMDLRARESSAGAASCKQKIETFLEGSFYSRAEVDLNIYYIVTLNDDATLSVVDPLFGFGGSRLLAMVFLNSPGEDWVLSPDQNRLFVSTPKTDEIAVVNTASWRVQQTISVPSAPQRIALQSDGKYLWVSHEAVAPSGHQVSVVDTDTLEVVARMQVGDGPHAFAFTPDDRYAFVSSRQAGTLTVIDIQRLERLRQLAVGAAPVDVAYSLLGRAVYVVSQSDGRLSIVDAQRHNLVRQVELAPGLHRIRFAPGGRFGFVLNAETSLVNILDAATNRVVQHADVTHVLGKAPDEVMFTQYLAYIRSRDSEHILMLPLEQIGQGGPLSLADFSGGQTPLSQGGRRSLADTIVVAPEGTAVIVANPADRMLYYYREGMAAPMGSFRNYGSRQPRAVLVVDRSLRETAPGVYTTYAKMLNSGHYEVAFFLDSPRVVHCFEARIKPDPTRVRTQSMPPLHIMPVVPAHEVAAGEEVRLRVKVRDAISLLPRSDLHDLGVLTFRAPGTWQRRQWARALGDGLYEIRFRPPSTGVYYVFFECPSLGVRYNQLPYVSLYAKGTQVSTAPVSEAAGEKP